MTTVEADRPARRRVRHRVLAVLVLAFAFVAGSLTLPAARTPQASAAAFACGGLRCTVYFNRAETHDLATGRLPAAAPGPFRSVLVIGMLAHRWFIQQYDNRGLCVGFTLTLVPWESQGLFSYRC